MKTIPVIILLSLLLLTVGCRDKTPYFTESGVLMNREYVLQYQSETRLMEPIDSLLNLCNNSLSVYNPHSILSRVNENEDVVVDEWFIDVFNKGVELSEMTGGIFDVTCLPLVRFWLNGGGFADFENISQHTVDSIRQIVGYNKIRIENGRVIKDDPRIIITLTAMVRGYTCDKIAALLEEHKVKNYMLNIGGAVVAKGVDKDGEPWQQAIRRPEETPDNRTVNMQELILIQQKGALATSGDFQNYYVRNGKKYAYTINPLTGYPSEQNILSTTILARDGATSEGLSTAFSIMGLEDAVRLGDSLPGLEYFLIYTDEQGRLQVQASAGMHKQLR